MENENPETPEEELNGKTVAEKGCKTGVARIVIGVGIKKSIVFVSTEMARYLARLSSGTKYR